MDSGFYYGGPIPLGPRPNPMNSLESDDPRITDYLLTSFEEYKITTAETLQDMKSKITTLTEELEELKEKVKGTENVDPKDKKTRRRIPKEISVS